MGAKQQAESLELSMELAFQVDTKGNVGETCWMMPPWKNVTVR
jgi:hypothetical protein